MNRRWIGCLIALLLTAGMLWAGISCRPGTDITVLPGSDLVQRQLLRIWVTGAPGGGMRWLEQCLAAFEKQYPGMMTYVRHVLPEDCLQAETKPDVILHMPGDLAQPELLFLPLADDLPCDEALLRCGRCKGAQLGLPVCWSAWVLALDSAYDVAQAATPAPTTLLGRPAATREALPTATPGYPAERVAAAETALSAPRGGGLFTLAALLTDGKPALAAESLQSTPETVYQAFLGRKTASALITTGQMTAFESLQRAGKGFPARMLIPETVVTDQVWLAGLCRDSEAARLLLSHLTGEEAQRRLTGQGLYGVDVSRVLYMDGNAALVEAAARRCLTAVNAYVPADDVAAAAWQAYGGGASLDDALLPLL